METGWNSSSISFWIFEFEDTLARRGYIEILNQFVWLFLQQNKRRSEYQHPLSISLKNLNSQVISHGTPWELYHVSYNWSSLFFFYSSSFFWSWIIIVRTAVFPQAFTSKRKSVAENCHSEVLFECGHSMHKICEQNYENMYLHSESNT